MFSQSRTIRFLESFGNVFFSLILGAIAMGFFWFYLPDEFVRLQRTAAAVREWIASRGWTTRTETIIRFLLEDRQLLLMSFRSAHAPRAGAVRSSDQEPVRPQPPRRPWRARGLWHASLAPSGDY